MTEMNNKAKEADKLTKRELINVVSYIIEASVELSNDSCANFGKYVLHVLKEYKLIDVE